LSVSPEINGLSQVKNASVARTCLDSGKSVED